MRNLFKKKKNVATNEFDQEIVGNSLGKDAWKRLRKNKMAVIGMIIVIIYALVSGFASLLPIYSYDTIILDHQDLPPTFTKTAGDLARQKLKEDLYAKAWKFKKLKIDKELDKKIRTLVKENKTNEVWDILYKEGERQAKEGIFTFDKASKKKLEKLENDIKTKLFVETKRIVYLPENKYLNRLSLEELINAYSSYSKMSIDNINEKIGFEITQQLINELMIEEPGQKAEYYQKEAKKQYQNMSTSNKRKRFMENIIGKMQYTAKIEINKQAQEMIKDNANIEFPLKQKFKLNNDLVVKAKVTRVFNRKYILGTDSAGRDLLSRIIYGGQVSIAIGLIGTITSVIIGIIMGALAGYKGGKVDYFIMRLVDIMYGLPYMLLVIIFIAISGRNITNLFFALAIVSWLTVARMVRGQIMSLKNQEFIEAAKSMGASTPRIIFKHLVPNSLSVIIVFSTLRIPSFIMMESFLSFLGLGVQAPRTSWGSLISDGVASMTLYPWKLFFPALAMTLFLFAMNFLGDGLRDAFDPQSKNQL